MLGNLNLAQLLKLIQDLQTLFGDVQAVLGSQSAAHAISVRKFDQARAVFAAHGIATEHLSLGQIAGLIGVLVQVADKFGPVLQQLLGQFGSPPVAA